MVELRLRGRERSVLNWPSRNTSWPITQVRTGQPVSVTPCHGLQPHLVTCSSLRTSSRAFQIDQHQVGVVADCDAALADDVPHAGRRVAHPVHDLLQRAAAAMHFVEHQRQRVLDRRQARGRMRVGLLLFFERVRRMIGGDDLDPAVAQRLPQLLRCRRAS